MQINIAINAFGPVNITLIPICITLASREGFRAFAARIDNMCM